jgi:selenide,water dikinase
MEKPNEIIRLTQYSHGGGCGCKIAPEMLTRVLAKMPATMPYSDLLVGTETSDDAAVYRINDSQAIVATTDFFMPIVDDPYDFGRIAAANALSDIYAMGARPIFALAIVGMPINKLPIESIQQILAGGAGICKEAGIPIAGGHSIDSPEPIYGLVAIGLVNPEQLKRNNQAQPGDVLILGKALGIGILSAALKRSRHRVLSRNAKQHYPAQHSRIKTGWHVASPRSDRCDRIWSCRSFVRNLPRLKTSRGD